MKEIKWVFVFYAIITAAAIIGIGVAIGERSILGIFIYTLLTIMIMGSGFKKKSKMRSEGKL